MKDSIKVILTAACTCIVVGLLMATSALFAGGAYLSVDFMRDGSVVLVGKEENKELTEAHTVTSDRYDTLKGIKIDTEFAEVIFQKGEKFQAEVTYYANFSSFRATEENGVLIVEEIRKSEEHGKKVLFQINSFIGDYSSSYHSEGSKIIVTVPENASLSTLDINCEYGRLDLGGLKADTMNIYSESGDMNIQDISAQELKIRNSYGSGELKTVTAGNLSYKAETGSMQFNGINASGEVSVSGESSSIFLDSVSCKALDMKNSYGSSRIANSKADTLTFQGETGEIDVEGLQLSGDASFKQESSGINLKDFHTDGDLTVANAYGEMTFSNVSANRYNGTQESGGARLDNCTFASIFYIGQSGKLNGTTLSLGDGEISVDYGDIDLDGTFTGELSIRAESGSISLHSNGARQGSSYNLVSEYGDVSVNGEKSAHAALQAGGKPSFTVQSESSDIKLQFDQ